jgi:hypothetical protein
MAAAAGRRRPALVRGAASVLLAPATGLTRLRRNPPSEPVTLALLAAMCALFVAVFLLGGPVWSPAAALGLPLILGGLLLTRRRFRWLAALVAVSLAVEVNDVGLGIGGVRPGAVAVTALIAGISYEFTRTREETGLSGGSAENVLVELRQRLEQQGQLPRLPEPWHAEATLCPAGGGPFAGDFVASSLSDHEGCLQVVLVDVSGKGVAAGTRALLLSGALGGLLGAVPAADFLPAANAYLDRQDWDEGFATAVHLVLDLRDGTFAVRSAGHPPVAALDAGSGRWSLLDAEGAALGLLPEVSYAPSTGRLEPGDALLLYTDGLVEVPGATCRRASTSCWARPSGWSPGASPVAATSSCSGWPRTAATTGRWSWSGDAPETYASRLTGRRAASSTTGRSRRCASASR